MRRRGPRPRRIAYAGFRRCGTTTSGGRPRTAAQDHVRGILPLRDDRGGTKPSRQSRHTVAQDCGWPVAVTGALSGAGAVGGARAVSVAARIRRWGWGWSRPRPRARARAGDGTTAGGGEPGAAEDHSRVGAWSMGRICSASEVGPEPSQSRSQSRRRTTVGGGGPRAAENHSRPGPQSRSSASAWLWRSGRTGATGLKAETKLMNQLEETFIEQGGNMNLHK